MTLRALAIIAALTVAASAHAERLPVDVRITRGASGVVAIGGVDVVEIDVMSSADVPLQIELTTGSFRRVVDVAARGRSHVTLARRLGWNAPTPREQPLRLSAGTASLDAVIPPARLVARPVFVLTDDAMRVMPRVDAWRRAGSLGEPIALGLATLPRWQAMLGAGAIAIDRSSSLSPEAARLVVRAGAATGARVCDFAPGVEQPQCAESPTAVAPRTRQTASIAHVVRSLAAAAALLALVLGVLAVPRRRLFAAVALAMIASIAVAAIALAPPATPTIRGARIALPGDEDFVSAQVGASELAGTTPLEGDLWIEPHGADAMPLGDAGLSGRVAPGSFTVLGFVPADTAWTRAIARSAR